MIPGRRVLASVWPRCRAHGRAARSARLFLGLALAAADVVALAGCDKNPTSTFLRAPGEPPRASNGAIQGRLEFGTGSFPPTLILAVRDKNAGCSSSYTTIQVVGTPTGFNISQSPHLTQLAPCFWVDTLTVPAGAFEWKFVTNGVFDNPPDYGMPGSQVDGLIGTAVNGAAGPDGNLKADVGGGEAGLVVCTLDEGAQPAPYAFRAIAPGGPATFSSTTDGRFSFSGLAPGNYNVLIRAQGQLPRLLSHVAVGDTPTDLGTISFAISGNHGGIRGQLAYDPTVFPDLSAPPYPPTTVSLYAGELRVDSIAVSQLGSTFEFTGLAPGTYTVRADAHLFGYAKSDTIAVTSFTRDAGTITLPVELGELTSQMNLLGSFNGWPAEPFPDSTAMDQIALGVWQYPNSQFPAQAIAADLHYFKFVTDGSFENPTDLGGDESITLAVPLTNVVTRFVSGGGTAIKARFTTTGAYRFTLDERRLVFSVEPNTMPSMASARARRR